MPSGRLDPVQLRNRNRIRRGMLARTSNHSVQVFLVKFCKQPEDHRKHNMQLVQILFVNVNHH